MIHYNAGIALLEEGIRIAGHWVPKDRMWAEGRKDILSRIRAQVRPDDRIFWIHAASVGEFEQGRPIIEYVRSHYPEYRILLTFYSPSGYELRKNYKGADYIFYFPSDKPSVAREFIDIIHPEAVVFIKYEFWLNTLAELRRRHIRTFLVSSIFLPDSIFFKPWGRDWRQALKTFETIFVQNDASRVLLAGIGVDNVVVAGDTRFDRVAQIVRSATELETVERFCAGKRVFVAGSTWGPDEELLLPLMNANPDVKFIIAPHEMDRGRICRLLDGTKGGASLYTAPADDIEDRQLLVIDTIGLLSRIYRYASWVYVGGGFGAGIHNTVEPASYGLPLAFGPRYKKFDEAVAMTELGIARPVCGYADLQEWFASLKADEKLRLDICDRARKYTLSQLGATELIFKTMAL